MAWVCTVCSVPQYKGKRGNVCYVRYKTHDGGDWRVFNVCSACDMAHSWPTYVRQP